MIDITFKYTYGEPEDEKTYFTKLFDIYDIEAGYHFDVLENEPLFKTYRIIDREII